MAWEEAVQNITMEADATIGIYTGPPGLPGSAAPNTGKQYCFVKATATARRAGLADNNTSTALVLGVLQNKPQATGASATVAVGGASLVMAGAGGLAAGDAVKIASDGRGIKATIGTDDRDVIVGVCVAGAAAGALATVVLKLV